MCSSSTYDFESFVDPTARVNYPFNVETLFKWVDKLENKGNVSIRKLDRYSEKKRKEWDL